MKRSRKILRSLAFFLGGCAAFGILFLFLYHRDNKYTLNCTQPVGGILHVTEQDISRGPLFLANGWQYYDNSLLTPDDFKEKMPETVMQLITLGKYNDFSLGNVHKSPYGCASYRLIINVPDTPRIYTLHIPEIYSSYCLYLNDDLLLSVGDISGEKQEIGKKTVSFLAGGRIELLIAAKNSSHFYSGLTSLPVFGLTEQVQKYHDSCIFIHSLVLALLLILTVIVLYTGILSHNPNILCFSVLCLLMAIQTAYPVLYNSFTRKTSFWSGLELFAIYAVYLLLLRLQHIFLQKSTIGYPVFSRILAVFCILALCYGNIPIQQTSLHLLFSFLTVLIKIAILLYLAVNMIYSACLETEHMALIAFLNGILSVSLLSDRLFPFYEPVYGGYFMEYSGLLLVIAGCSVLFAKLIRAYRFKIIFARENQILNKQIDMQKANHRALLAKIEETRRQRHDIRHHMHTVYSLLQNNDIKNAMAYLESYRSSSGEFETLFYCTNTAADALLRYYHTRCAENNISFQADLTLSPDVPISDVDITIILGNLLENAYDACLKYQGEQPFIRLYGKQTDSGFVLSAENSFSNPVRLKAGRFYSSFRPEPGLGTASVKAVVKKYNGIIDIEPCETVFSVKLLLQI